MTDPVIGQLGDASQPAPTPARSHVELLQQQIARLDEQLKGEGSGAASTEARALRDDLAAELDLVEQAVAGKVQLPVETQAYVEPLAQTLSGEEVAIVQAKAAELSRGGYGVEQTSGPRFAANLALELSEYLAMGATPSAALEAVVSKTVEDGMSVFIARPELRDTFQHNISVGKRNAAVRNRR